jgi:hypothetical protein
MTTKTICRALKRPKLSVLRENGKPRFMVLDWDTYHVWETKREDLEDHIRFEVADRESRGKKRHTLAAIKKKYRLF